MKLKHALSILFLGLSSLTYGQDNTLIIKPNITLPKDSLTRLRLVDALNNFIRLKDGPNAKNTLVLNDAFLETSALLDEMKDIEKNKKLKDDHFYKGYLSNVVQLDSENYLIQLTYIGIDENSPVLRASFDLRARYRDNGFLFYSPLSSNTILWKTKKIGAYIFHFKNTLNIAGAAEYEKRVIAICSKLKITDQHTDFYSCDNFPEVQRILGVLYRAEYNGYDHSSLSSQNENKYLQIDGVSTPAFSKLDLHDLWHDRLHQVLSTKIINKPVDEACAYLYGGSWGISWQQILKTFKEKVASNPKADLLALYESFYNFGESDRNHLIAGYVMNALIVQQLEKEKGFTAVMELLSCGNYEKGNANYFKALEKLTGINRLNFNDKVWALIKKS